MIRELIRLVLGGAPTPNGTEKIVTELRRERRRKEELVDAHFLEMQKSADELGDLVRAMQRRKPQESPGGPR